MRWAALETGRTESSATLFGGEMGWDIGDQVAVFAGGETVRFASGDPARNRGRAGVLFRLPVPGMVCLTGAVEHDRLGELRATSVPIGLWVGGNLARPDSDWRLVPFVEPQMAYRRASIPGFHEAGGQYSMRAGALIGWGRVHATIRYEKSLGVDLGSSLRARIGLRF